MYPSLDTTPHGLDDLGLSLTAVEWLAVKLEANLGGFLGQRATPNLAHEVEHVLQETVRTAALHELHAPDAEIAARMVPVLDIQPDGAVVVQWVLA